MDNFDALNQACINGIGVFLTGDVLVKQELEKQHLIHLLPQLQFTNHEIYLFYRNYSYELPKIRAFVDYYDYVSQISIANSVWNRAGKPLGILVNLKYTRLFDQLLKRSLL